MTFKIFLIALLLCLSNFVFMCVNGCLQMEQLPKNSDDPRLMSPWVASIFKKNQNGIWEYKCGATVTSPFTVITAASCVTTIKGDGNFKEYHVRYTELRVVVGLLTNNYYERDGHTQESEVAMVRENKPPASVTKTGYVQTYTRPANLAGILLTD